MKGITSRVNEIDLPSTQADEAAFQMMESRLGEDFFGKKSLSSISCIDETHVVKSKTAVGVTWKSLLTAVAFKFDRTPAIAAWRDSGCTQ